MAKYKFFVALLFWFVTCGVITSHVSPLETKALPKLHSPKAPLTASKREDILTSDTIKQLLFQRPPLLPLSTNSINQQFQWWNSREPVSSGWFGFNHFIPRSARALPLGVNSKLRSSYLLGEGTHMYPTMNFNAPQPITHFDHTMMGHHQNRNFHRIPQGQQHYVMHVEQPVRIQQGYMLPVVSRDNHQSNHRQYHHHHHNRPSGNMHRLPTAPMPVTIKIVPLKLTSRDIAEALKAMSWVPIPLNLLNLKQDNGEKDDDDRSYDDDKDRFGTIMMLEEQQEEDSDLPPPSSHVATPLEKPLGVTYADAQISEIYERRFHPRK